MLFFDKYTCPVWDIVGDCGRQDRILENMNSYHKFKVNYVSF